MDVIEIDLFFLGNFAFLGFLLIFLLNLKNLFVEHRNQNITENINMKALILNQSNAIDHIQNGLKIVMNKENENRGLLSNQSIVLSHIQNELKKILEMENEIRRLMEDKKTIIIEHTKIPEQKRPTQTINNQRLTSQRTRRVRKRKPAQKQLIVSRPLLLSNDTQTITPLVERASP